jgi:hypothetical protein
VAKQWLAARQADLLPVPSYHVVLASNMRSVMKIAGGNMISDVLDALLARLQRRLWCDNLYAADHRRMDLLVPLWRRGHRTGAPR